MADDKKKLKTARSKAELIRTVVGILQLVVAITTLVLVLHGNGLLSW